MSHLLALLDSTSTLPCDNNDIDTQFLVVFTLHHRRRRRLRPRHLCQQYRFRHRPGLVQS